MIILSRRFLLLSAPPLFLPPFSLFTVISPSLSSIGWGFNFSGKICFVCLSDPRRSISLTPGVTYYLLPGALFNGFPSSNDSERLTLIPRFSMVAGTNQGPAACANSQLLGCPVLTCLVCNTTTAATAAVVELVAATRPAAVVAFVEESEQNPG